MALQKCHECGKKVSTEAEKCVNCGAPVVIKESNKSGCLTKLGLFIFVLFIIGLIGSLLGPSKKGTPAPPAIEKAPEAQTPVVKITPAEHLDAAKKALADGYSPNKDIMKISWGRVADAREYIEAIDENAPEYIESRKLLSEIERREKGIEKASAIAAKALMINQRKDFADRLETIYLEKGMDVSVSVHGKENKALKMKWILMNRPTVYKIINNRDVMDKLEVLDFDRFILTDGYRTTYTYDLKKRDWR